MKINKLCIYFLIVLAGVILPRSVKASEMYFGPNGAIYVYSGSTYYFQVDGNHNNLPKTFPSVAGGASQSLGVVDMYFSPASGNVNILDNFNYNYLIFDTCATGYFQLIISNNGCNNSCVSSGTYTPLKLEGTSCTAGSYTGSRYLLQIPIQKWYLNTVSEMLEVSSYITYKSTASFYISNTVNHIFLSDEDYLQTYRDHAQLVAKLDSVATAISNLQSGIINNNNTNTQNIINNQNTNAQQAHNDAVNTQNTIKDDSVDNPNSSITTIKNSLATNGVITSLVVLPVTLYQAILNSVNGTCATFSLGSLFGTNLTIPCINVANYLGTTLWGSIDVIISGIFIYMISRKMIKVFNQLSSLKEGDVLDG